MENENDTKVITEAFTWVIMKRCWEQLLFSLIEQAWRTLLFKVLSLFTKRIAQSLKASILLKWYPIMWSWAKNIYLHSSQSTSRLLVRANNLRGNFIFVFSATALYTLREEKHYYVEIGKVRLHQKSMQTKNVIKTLNRQSRSFVLKLDKISWFMPSTNWIQRTWFQEHKHSRNFVLIWKSAYGVSEVCQISNPCN